MIGRQLSHYRIVAEIGSGGMGTVYRAEDTRLGRVVALKLPHPTLASDAAARTRLLWGARVGMTLVHPNIVRIVDVGEAEGTLFLAMEYVAGETLRDRLRGPMPPSRVIAIGHALAAALAHAHECGVVHRDVKPDNVFLDDAGHVQLADFGLSPLEATGAHVARDAIVGTIDYLAPEVILGGAPGPHADLYALGVTLYELGVGTPPFGGQPAELAERALHEAPPPLPVTVPSALAELIEALLAKEPTVRPDAAAVATRLAAMMPGAT